MKIALFTDTFTPQINGVTNTLTQMVKYFENMDIEYLIFAPKYDNNDSKLKAEQFYSLPLFFYPECRVAFPNTFKIDQILRDFKPDIIHLMTEFNMGLTGMRYAKKYNIPCIASYTTNFSQYVDYYKMNFLKNTSWNYIKWFHDQVDLTVCPSTEAENLLNRKGIIKTEIFSRGIDCDSFSPEKRSEKLRQELGVENKFAFLYVGRISVEKDLDILAKAYRQIKSGHKDSVAMIITGDGPYIEKCKELFPADTIFTGFQTGHKLAAIYASCDVFVCPSTSETFGNVVLEAMASGTAVIGANAGGIKDTIQHGITGLKFKGGDYIDLSKNMNLLMLDSSLRRQLSASGIQYGKNTSWDKIIWKLLRDYHNLINRSNSSQKENYSDVI